MSQAKKALDTIIKKSRVHLYKPIQIAEILYRHRNNLKNLKLDDLNTYRTSSKRWRDNVTHELIDSVCSSSARFQDNLFENNAIPPTILLELGKINKKHSGVVEAYIYKQLENKYFQLNNALDYCINTSAKNFNARHFIERFNKESGLKRSIDKVFEIVVYALFEVLTTSLKISVDVYSDSADKGLIKEFHEFSNLILQLNQENKFKNSG